ncbi:MAG: hypothetical protein HC819_07120 [Cyclobacteriaceae bacterium]|nr:hypothetical protein [Cyclobacteriaceae bacterium]
MRKVIIISILAYCPLLGYAQKSTLDLLQQCKWEQRANNMIYHTQKFTQDSLYIYYRETMLIGVVDYYLSDTIVSEFDPDKVGKIRNGKYIIYRIKDNVSVLEIIELTPEILKTKSLAANTVVVVFYPPKEDD